LTPDILQEIINIIKTSKPEIEARYCVMRMGDTPWGVPGRKG